jgi:hypothetical protein
MYSSIQSSLLKLYCKSIAIRLKQMMLGVSQRIIYKMIMMLAWVSQNMCRIMIMSTCKLLVHNGVSIHHEYGLMTIIASGLVSLQMTRHLQLQFYTFTSWMQNNSGLQTRMVHETSDLIYALLWSLFLDPILCFRYCMQFVFLNVSYRFFLFCLICQIHIFGPATIFHYQMQFFKLKKVSLEFKAFSVNFQIHF